MKTDSNIDQNTILMPPPRKHSPLTIRKPDSPHKCLNYTVTVKQR